MKGIAIPDRLDRERGAGDLAHEKGRAVIRAEPEQNRADLPGAELLNHAVVLGIGPDQRAEVRARRDVKAPSWGVRADVRLEHIKHG